VETFTTQKSITTIKRQTYSGEKSSFASVGTATAYLRPLDLEQSTNNRVQFGLGFSLIFEVDVDIREGDKVTIDSVEYTVRGVVNHNRGSARIQYKKAIITLPEKQ
jgi:hypothetical protein